MERVARAVDERFVHGGLVTQVMWTPAGERLVAAARGEIACWTASGALLWRSPGAEYGLGLALSPDASVLYAAHVDHLSCLDMATGAERWRIDYSTRYLAQLVCLPGGDLLMIHGFVEVERVEVATQTITTLHHINDGNGVGDAARSPAGEQVVLRVHDGLLIIDAGTGREVQRLTLNGAMKVRWLAPDHIVATNAHSAQLHSFKREAKGKDKGKWAAAGAASMIWGRNTGLACTIDPSHGPLGVMCSTHGDVACVALDTGHQRWRITPGGAPDCLAISPSGSVLAIALGQRVALYDLASGAGLAGADAGPLPYRALSLSPDGARLIAGYAADAVHAHVLDAQTLERVDTLVGASVGAFAPDGRIIAAGTWLGVGLSAGEPGVALSHDIGRGKNWGERRLYTQVAVCPEGRWMVASGGGSVESTLEVWDLHAEALAKTLVSGGMNAPGRSLVASPDGVYVACVTEGKSDVSLYDTAKWKKVAHKPGKGQPTALAWRSDATLLFGATAKGLAWAMAPDGAVRWTQTTKKVAWTACAAGGDALVLGAASGAVHVLDSATGAERAVLSFGAPITALLLTDFGRLYVATGALELSAVDLSAHVGALERPAVAPAAPALKPLPQRWHKNPLVSVALSPDRRYLATGTWLDHDGDGDDEQGELFVWDVVTGACVRRVEPVMWGVGWPDYKEMVQWSPDGQQIGAAVCTNAVAAWRLEGRAQAPLATHEITDGGSRPPSWCWRPDGQGFAIAAWTGSSVGVALVTHAQRHAATYGGATAIDAPAAPQQEIFFPDRLVWSRDGRWLCGERGDTIEVYDMQARVLARRLVFSDAVVSWSADGALLAVREADVLRVIEAATGATRWEALEAPQGEVFLSPDGERAALLGEDEAWIVDSAGATQLADAAPASQDGYDQVADAPRWAWSPDGARGALREAAAAVVYDAQTGARGWSCEVSDEVGGVAWGAEDTLAAWTTNTLALWKIGARKPVKRYARSVE